MWLPRVTSPSQSHTHSNVVLFTRSATCSRIRCCSSSLLLSVCVVAASVCIPFAPSVGLPHLNAKLREQLCVGSLLSRQSQHMYTHAHTCTHARTHTHHLLSCGASCPDCVNPLCPPHISLHPSTSTPLWWRHTHARAHTHTLTTLHHYHCFSWRRVSAFVCNYGGLKWKGRIFKKRERRGWMVGKGGKKKD